MGPWMPGAGEMLRGNAKPRGGGLPGKARRSFGGLGRVNRDADRTNGEDCHTMVTMTATACPSLGRGPFSGRGGPAGLFPWDRLVRVERGARGCAHFPGAGRAAPRRSARGRASVCWPPASRSSTASEHPPGTCRALFTCELVSRASERHSLTTTSPAAGFLIWECVCVWPI